MSCRAARTRLQSIELKVGSVLEGSFRKAGNKIRVTTQLIDVAGDEHLWAQNYDRNLDDVFEVQSDVAKQVAEALRVRILSPEMERINKKPTESTKAYTFYLKGRYFWNKRGTDDLRKAAECFELAVKEDPSYALGYSGLADCFILLRNNWGIDSEVNLAKAKTMAAKALEIDSGLAEAHASMAMIQISEYDLRRAEEEFKRAIELKPSYATAHQWHIWVLGPQQRWTEAFAEIERAVELDPMSPVMSQNLGQLFSWKREYVRAIEPYRRAIELGYGGAHGSLADTYGRLGMYDDMRREMAAYVEYMLGSIPQARTLGEIGVAYYEGEKQVVGRLLPELEAHYREPGIGSYFVAMLHFHLGENEKGFEWLERAYAEKGFSLTINLDPDFDAVRTDPRYLALLRRVGLD